MPYIGNVVTGFNVGTQNINNGAVTGEKLSQPFNYDSGTLYLDDTNNRVGILTASPTSTLTIGTGGVLSIPLGAAATPSLIFGTDVNTGIYSPGADQVAISTNGTGRLFVDSSGLIGIGRQPLAARTLSVQGRVGVVNQSGSNDTQLAFYSDGITNGIYSTYNATGSYVPLTFYTSDVERMRLDSSGRLGLGTSSPGDLCHIENGALRVNTNNSVGAVVKIDYDSSNATRRIHALETGGGNARPLRIQAQTLALADDLATRLFIDLSGRLGIGTTTPTDTNGYGTTLDIRGSSTGNGGVIYLRNSDATVTGQLAVYGDGRMDFGTTTNHPLRFFTNNTERGRWDTSGRFLVGTSSARSNFFGSGSISPLFQLEGTTTSATAISTHRSSNDDNQSYVILSKARSSSFGIVSSGDSIGEISFQAADGTNLIQAARITAAVDGTPGTNDMPGRIVFSTTADGASSPTERMRISNVGELFNVGTSSSFFSATTQGAGTTFATFIGRHSATAGNYSSGTNSCIIYSNGNIQNTNNSYGSLSDLKLKENIVDAGSQWNDLRALQVRKYNFKEETGQETHTQIGLIAQEVELVSPGLVSESPDRDAEGNDLGTVTKSVNYSVLYMKAVKALQEAMERIETLEASNSDLLSRVIALENA